MPHSYEDPPPPPPPPDVPGFTLMTVDPGIDFTLSDAIWRLCMWFHVRLLCNKAKNKEKVADGQMLTLRDLFYGEVQEVMVYVAAQSKDYVPGTWKELKTNIGVSASFTCPTCGKLAVLIDHSIDVDGTVSPSVVCPTEGCSFHEFVRLDGWKEVAP